MTGLKVKKREYGINLVLQNRDVLSTYCVPAIWCANIQLAVGRWNRYIMVTFIFT